MSVAQFLLYHVVFRMCGGGVVVLNDYLVSTQLQFLYFVVGVMVIVGL